MKLHLFDTVVLAFLPLLLKTLLYLVACRLRSIHITLLNAIIVAGAGALVGFIQLPIPFVVRQPLVIGVAMFLFARFTEAELYPDVIFIPLVVEILSVSLMEMVIIPSVA